MEGSDAQPSPTVNGRIIRRVSVLQAEARKRDTLYSFAIDAELSILCLIVLRAIAWLRSLDTARTKRDRVNPLSIPKLAVRFNELEPAGAIFRRVGLDDTSILAINGRSESVREAIALAEIVGTMRNGHDHFVISDYNLVFRSSRSGGNGSGKSDSGKSDSGQQSKDGLHFLEIVGGLIALRSVGQKKVS